MGLLFFHINGFVSFFLSFFCIYQQVWRDPAHGKHDGSTLYIQPAFWLTCWHQQQQVDTDQKVIYSQGIKGYQAATTTAAGAEILWDRSQATFCIIIINIMSSFVTTIIHLLPFLFLFSVYTFFLSSWCHFHWWTPGAFSCWPTQKPAVKCSWQGIIFWTFRNNNSSSRQWWC